MTTVFGWWDLDSNAPAMVNRLSGERVLFRGPVAPADAPDAGRWWRFEYRHEELRYPILVELTQPSKFHRVQRRHHWRIDHRHSAKAWRREASQDQLFPPYGLWHRVDGCVTDAMICWPTLEASGQPEGLSATGGWVNSTWRDGLERHFPELQAGYRKGAEARGLEPAAPFIMPIDQPAPARWRFHETPLPEDRRREDAFPLWVSLSGLTAAPASQVGAKDSLVLPEGVPLEGHERAMAYMRSEDGARVLFTSSGVDKATSAQLSRDDFTFTYADPDLVFMFSARNISAINRAYGFETDAGDGRDEWKFDLSFRTTPLRRPKATPEFYLRRLANSHPFAPSPALWQRVSWAVTDAWLVWPGTEVRSASWPKSLSLAGVGSLILSGRTVAGMLTGGDHCRVELSELP